MSFNPFGKDIPLSLGDLQGEINRMFDRLWHGGLSTRPFDGSAWAPTFDVLEEEDRVVVMAEIPGVDASEVELSFQDDRLVLKGHRESPWSEEASKRLIRRERRFGPFSRTIDMPAGIDPDKISATARSGVITVTLAKIEQARGKSIRIEAAD